MPSVLILNVIMLSVTMLIVIMLSVVMLNVVTIQPLLSRAYCTHRQYEQTNRQTKLGISNMDALSSQVQRSRNETYLSRI